MLWHKNILTFSFLHRKQMLQ